jgi:hypothetical protein
LIKTKVKCQIKTLLLCPFQSDSCSFISNIYISVHWSVSEIAILILSVSLNFIWRNDKWYNKRVLIWHFTLVLIKINYGQIGDQTALLYNKPSCAKYDRGLDLGFWEILKPLKWTNITSFFLIWLKKFTKICISLWI